LESVVKVLDKIAEGDLTVEVPAVFKEREDMIGRLSKAADKVLEYMKNFTSKTLDYSVKLVDQVDNVFRLVDSVNEKIKFQNLQVAQTSIISEDFALTVGSISRNTSAINNIAKEILTQIEKLKHVESQEQPEILVKILGLLEGLNAKILEIAEDLDKGLKTSESINEAFEEITQVSNEISQLMDKMSENAYETLLISSYMKTIASTVKTKKMEEMLFELFEKDIDRYMLRLQAHIKGIDRLDPERWGDYQAFPLGKWYYSEEGQSLKKMIQDFDFDEFESLLKNLHNVGKDLIVAYNQEDSIKVEKLQVQLRGIARRLKLLLDELREHYSKIKTL
jgi:methyl-accepting chemotaxis protein